MFSQDKVIVRRKVTWVESRFSLEIQYSFGDVVLGIIFFKGHHLVYL
jgi:hypothetical protein